MHRAKAFLMVCAGVFLLALSYNLGARSAGAQAGITASVGAAIEQDFMALSGRTLYGALQIDYPGVLAGYYTLPPVPGTSEVIAIGRGTFDTQLAVLADGDCYQYRAGTGWHLIGNLLTAATPARAESWGAVKSRYRGESGAAQPAQDR